MRQLSNITNIQTEDLDNSKAAYRITLQFRLMIAYIHERRTTVYSHNVVTDDFLCVRHGKNWMSFADIEFRAKYIIKLKTRYPSMRLPELENVIRHTQRYNAKKLKSYALALHANLHENDVTIAFEDMHLPYINGIHFAIPTGISLLINDPTGRCSSVTKVLDSLQ